MAGKYLIKIIEKAGIRGYIIKITYIFLENPELCIERIKLRVVLGGHFVPDEDVRRRFTRSKNNFWNIYKNISDNWQIYYNASSEYAQIVALGDANVYVVENEKLFLKFIADLF